MEHKKISYILAKQEADILYDIYLEVYKSRMPSRKEVWLTDGCRQKQLLSLVITPVLILTAR